MRQVLLGKRFGLPDRRGDKMDITSIERGLSAAASIVRVAGIAAKWVKNTVQRRTPAKLQVKLHILLGSQHLGPSDLTVLPHQEPKHLIDAGFDKCPVLPLNSTDKSQRIFWLEGERFLEETKSFKKQKVHPGHTLVLTDRDDGVAVHLIISTFQQR